MAVAQPITSCRSLFNQLRNSSTRIKTTFNQNTSHPISLGWYETCDDDNLHCDLKQVNTRSRNSSRNRKMPVTRSKDFLW